MYVVSNNPIKCAMALDDLRLSYTALRVCQILSSAFRALGCVHSVYGKELLKGGNYTNHPIVKWARESQGNLAWLVNYVQAIEAQRRFRGLPPHSTISRLLPLFKRIIKMQIGLLKKLKKPRTPFLNLARNSLKELDCTQPRRRKSGHLMIPNVKASYKEFLSLQWDAQRFPPTWTNIGPPEWYVARRKDSL